MARLLLPLAAMALALAGCNKGSRQAAGDHAVAVNSTDNATDTPAAP